MGEKKRVSIQQFRPKEEQLKRMLKQADKKGLEDIKGMAENTIKDAPKFVKDEEKRKKMTEDAKKTIADVDEEEKKREGK
jgi:ribosome recycling factor